MASFTQDAEDHIIPGPVICSCVFSNRPKHQRFLTRSKKAAGLSKARLKSVNAPFTQDAGHLAKGTVRANNETYC